MVNDSLIAITSLGNKRGHRFVAPIFFMDIYVKKLLNRFVIRLFILLAFSPVVSAEQAKGVIEEIQICGTGSGLMPGQGWIRTIQFKIDGKWFGLAADYYGHPTGDVDNEISVSLIYMAYAQNLVVDIKATDPWWDFHKACGVSQGAQFHGSAGDYIRIAR
ncbi:hypothetical protein M3P05_12585 [Sansalvadorimonas sp. 2012CJ34-2]|uniref:Uncharacterized protein n=1 Tax=Parendozoicomonas callyspongiae TaxID=2942213 RepID=A0ABT0PIC5_9GAMM|nr:hypothetical protein [Sansalvadorimonas sp. 2012CJ34-2]MCL6270761.1 hypothetical protein [Sansalvadorimonas sp. 2012CJ34-2]